MKRGIDLKSLVLGALCGTVITLVVLSALPFPMAHPLQDQPLPGEVLQQHPEKQERRGNKEVWTLVLLAQQTEKCG